MLKLIGSSAGSGTIRVILQTTTAELAMYDNASSITRMPTGNNVYTLVKSLYQKSLAEKLRKSGKKYFSRMPTLLVITKRGDRVYIEFLMRPKRQLIVALKSRGWWWNSYRSLEYIPG